MRCRFVSTRMLASLLFPLALTALAQERYPSRPIEIIVPWGPGGGADQLARKTGKLMETELKASFPVLNVPGATGQTGMTKMLANPPDGYSLQVFIADTFALLAGQQPPKWRLEDVIPVGVMIRQSSAFMVADNSRFKNWADVEKEAKANPGKLKVAVTGFGSVDDMTVNFLAAKGIRMISVPFANPGERYASILGGHADILYEQPGDVRSFLDGKQMRPVLIFCNERAVAFKDVPCAKELGYDIVMPQFRSLVVKAGTDPQRVKTLSDALAKVAADPEYKAYLKEQYADDDSFIPAAGALKFMQGELDAMKRIIATSTAK